MGLIIGPPAAKIRRSIVEEVRLGDSGIAGIIGTMDCFYLGLLASSDRHWRWVAARLQVALDVGKRWTRPNPAKACWLLGLVLLASVGAASADEPPISRRHHPWLKFHRGSWKQVRTTTESFDSEGRLVSTNTTESKTTLEKIAPDAITLRVEVSYAVGGKWFNSEPQFVKQTFSGEAAGQAVEVKTLPPELLEFDSRKISCRSQQIEFPDGKNRRITLVQYSDRDPPYIFRTKTTTKDSAGNLLNESTESEVVALDMPYIVLGESKSASYVKITHATESGITTTLSVNVADIPGEEVAANSKKIDRDGRVIKKSTTQLLAYQAQVSDTEPESASTRANRRERNRRKR